MGFMGRGVNRYAENVISALRVKFQRAALNAVRRSGRLATEE